MAAILTTGQPAGAQTPTPKFRYDQKIMADPPAGPPPLKKRITIARFEDSTTIEDSPFGVLDKDTLLKHQNDDLSSPLSKELATVRVGFTERLITALFATDRFVVIERQDIHKILREVDFSKTERVAQATAVPQGEILSGQYIVTGVITLDHGEAGDTTSDAEVQVSIPIPGSRFRIAVGSGRTMSADPGSTEGQGTDSASSGDRSIFRDMTFECRRANPTVPSRFVLHLRVYDVASSQIVSAVRVGADNQWCLIKAAVQRMVVQMDRFPWKSRVAAVEGQRVLVEGGRDVNMSHGYRLVHQPTTPAGTSNRMPVAQTDLSVIEVHDTASVATRGMIITTGEIRPGDWVVSNPSQAGGR
jgi:hypothetical protein